MIALQGVELKNRKILEIGPLDRPVVAKSTDWQTFYLDHCSTEQLIAKYQDNPVIHKDKIVQIDFVSEDGSLSKAAIGDNRFDCIVASHVIEHVPNLVGWLSDCCAALSPRGVLALVIPDRRYTFDHFRRTTPRAWIEAAHIERYARPGLDQVSDHFCNAAKVESADIWAGRDVSQAPRLHDALTLSRAIADWNAGAYIDCHSWVFEHDSFAELIAWISDRFSVNLKLRKIAPPVRGQLEFYVQLVRQ
ncbi:MAG TPA: methyltransferase domain-containing protein [Roseiarcus sp.]|nr:methyltransferase domain-containing protein [Roseiarcus sp.]